MFGTPTTSSRSDASHAYRIPAKGFRVFVVFLLVIATSCFGAWTMFDILRANGTTALEGAVLVLFTITFAWVTISFWSAIIGFILQLFHLDPLTLKRYKSPRLLSASQSKNLSRRQRRGNASRNEYRPPFRVAVIMPVYNEDANRVCAGFEANLRSLAKTGALSQFDFYLLSDTQDKEKAEVELAAWHGLKARLGDLGAQAFYRRREKNTHRKVGNVADFCTRWGSRYEAMIVLDADSIMTGDCMLSLSQALHANPDAGLIQTVPVPVRQKTFFGRFLQFSAALCSPMLANGLAFWQTDCANYWGHNAIIRIQAFQQQCGLPTLPGSAPFGGEILSHDFVEAALLRRAGWSVFLLPNLKGSYEEVPSNILDYVTRDRRWVQGNVQHLGLLRSAGFRGISRMHLFLGAIAYISSLFWLLMLALSTADALIRAQSDIVFFSNQYQLFPDWPIAKTSLIFSLLFLTACMLLVPKLLSVVEAAINRRAEFGGVIRLFFGATLETVFAILIAPVMMVFHAYFVVSVLIGHQVNWNAQSRGGRMTPWSEAFKRTGFAAVIAIAWGVVTYFYSELFFWWLSPVLVGLISAPMIIRFSSSIKLGEVMGAIGIFAVPSEVERNPLLRDVRRFERVDYPAIKTAPLQSNLVMPRELPTLMPVQSFRDFRPTLTLDMNVDLRAELNSDFSLAQRRRGRPMPAMTNRKVV
ncbi:MAG: glucans biosynthesis glucosyltransferase MdoH [Ketobacter sp.]|nr:MAG: glucans biosynthesis glucosyltransferase MdoH [Ketobacter sp.]